MHRSNLLFPPPGLRNDGCFDGLHVEEEESRGGRKERRCHESSQYKIFNLINGLVHIKASTSILISRGFLTFPETNLH